VPLHQGVGLVKLRIPDAAPDACLDRDQSSQQHGAPPFLVAKYADWPFTCLWPESPASQPPPLPSRSPSPMSFSKTDPSPPKSSAPSNKQRHIVPDQQGMLSQQPAFEWSAAPAAAVVTKGQSELPSATGLKVVARSAERQAPKRLLDPFVGNKALARPYAKVSRDAEPHAEQVDSRHRCAPATLLASAACKLHRMYTGCTASCSVTQVQDTLFEECHIHCCASLCLISTSIGNVGP